MSRRSSYPWSRVVWKAGRSGVVSSKTVTGVTVPLAEIKKYLPLLSLRWVTNGLLLHLILGLLESR